MYLIVFNQRFTDRMLKILEGQGQGQQFQTRRNLHMIKKQFNSKFKFLKGQFRNLRRTSQFKFDVNFQFFQWLSHSQGITQNV